MDEIEALASERKSLAREVLRLERSVTDLGNRLKVTRGVSAVRNDLSEAAVHLRIARAKLATFDLDLMSD